MSKTKKYWLCEKHELKRLTLVGGGWSVVADSERAAIEAFVRSRPFWNEESSLDIALTTANGPVMVAYVIPLEPVVELEIEYIVPMLEGWSS